MSIEDLGYVGLVFRALKMDPDGMKVIRPPVFVSCPKILSAPEFPRPSQVYKPLPHLNPRPLPLKTYQQGAPDSTKCYTCRITGHRMTMCPRLREYISKGIVARDEQGRYIYADGRLIQQIPGETLIGAIKSVLPPGKNDKVNSHLLEPDPWRAYQWSILWKSRLWHQQWWRRNN